MDFSFIYFLIISLGVSHIWNFSDLFHPLRARIKQVPLIRKPLTCAVCSSFWIGLLVSLFYNPLINDVAPSFISYILLGASTYLSSVIIFPKIEQQLFSDKINLRGKKMKTSTSEWNTFYSNVSKTGSFTGYSVIKEGDELVVFFS